jgi:hypothetical protein
MSMCRFVKVFISIYDEQMGIPRSVKPLNIDHLPSKANLIPAFQNEYCFIQPIVKEQPLNNDHLQTTAAIFESQGCLLYTGPRLYIHFF